MDRIFRLPLYSALALLAYMPFHVFLSQWLSTFTGGLDFWKIAKDIFLLAAVLLTVVLVALSRGFNDRLFWVFTAGSVAYLIIHLLVWAANPAIDDPAALLATAYNCRLLAYAILGWGAVLAYPGTLRVRKIFKIAIFVSAIVALLGIIQFVLPKDVMTHFGYSLDRGVKPAFFIDEKNDLPRIMSTIRDPNSLGAYLILPTAALGLAWAKFGRQRMLVGGLLLLHVWALVLTFSRSAWLGAALALTLAFGWVYREKLLDFGKKYGVFVAIGLLTLLIGTFLLRDQYFVQNVVFHSDENTRLKDSNALHLDFARVAAEGIADKPFGHGPGTAGLVSIQTEDVVLTENYFLQIGYEVGLQGLILLLALTVFVLWLLYKSGSVYGKVLIASFAGVTVCALLLHTWSNEAVAAQWWLLAGFTIALARNNSRFAGKKTPQTP